MRPEGLNGARPARDGRISTLDALLRAKVLSPIGSEGKRMATRAYSTLHKKGTRMSLMF